MSKRIENVLVFLMMFLVGADVAAYVMLEMGL